MAGLLLLSSCAAGAAPADGLPTFLEAQALSGLIPQGLVMTEENQDGVVQYFEQLEEPERAYVLSLLRSIAAGEPTPADPYCDFEGGVYLSACQFCLYDMDLDGTPEFLLKTGSSEAEFLYTVYTILDGELVACGEVGGSHAALYANHTGGFVRYMGHMGTYEITESSLEGTVLVTRDIAGGTLGMGEEYPALQKFRSGDYEQPLEFREVPTLFLAPKG